jgi:hypothetical protein
MAEPEDTVKIYEKNIPDLRRQLYAVHESWIPGAVRIVAVGRPEKEIELDTVAARQLRDALTAFLDGQP